MALFNMNSTSRTRGLDIAKLSTAMNNNKDRINNPQASASFVGLESEYKAPVGVLESLEQQFKAIGEAMDHDLVDMFGEVGAESAKRTLLMLGDDSQDTVNALAANIKRTPGLEAFSKTNLGKYRDEMVAANGAALSQTNGVVDALYPIVQVGANYGGVQVTLKRFTIVGAPNYAQDSGAVNFKRRHILDAYRDSKILENEGNQLKPVIVTGSNEDKFVSADLFTPIAISGESQLKTAPLKLFSTVDSLLTLNQLPNQSATSQSTYNDRINDGAKIKTLWFQFGEDKTGGGGDDERGIVPVSVSMLNQATFMRGANAGESNDVTSTIESTQLVVATDSTRAAQIPALAALAASEYTHITLGYTLNSKLNLHTGNISQTASPTVTVTGVYKDGDTTNYVDDAGIAAEVAALLPEFAAQDFDITLSSKTLRLEGRRVDDQDIPFTFITSARPVITSEKAVDEADKSDLIEAMSALEVIDHEVNCITHLMSTIDALNEAYGKGGHGVNPIGSNMAGLTYIVKPWVKVEEVTASDFIDSEKSSERFYDICSAIVQRLADNAANALSETAYVEGKRMYTKNREAKAEFAVLTSRALGRYLYTEGDDRTFGANIADLEQKPKIVTTGLAELDDTLVMVPTSNGGDKGSFDAFAWGNTIRNPSLVYDVQISRNDSTKTHYQLQPVYELTTNMPIVYKLKLSGITDLLASKVAKKTVAG